MGRRRRAWLTGGTGRVKSRGRELLGYYARWSEYTPDGRRANRMKRFDTYGAAEAWVQRQNARADLGELGEIVPVTLRKAAEEFLHGCAALADETVTHYAGGLGLFRALIGDRPLSTVTGCDVDGFVAERIAVSAPATAAKHVRTLRRFFNWRLDQRYVSRQDDADDWWKRAMTAIGVPGLWFRDLRALASGRLQRLAGMSLVDVQRLLGHASSETTATHYTLPAPDVARRLATGSYDRATGSSGRDDA